MAYQAKRHQHYIEQLELVDEKGEVSHVLNVDVDPAEMAEKLSKKYVDLLKAKREADDIDKSNPDLLVEAYEKLGNAVMSLIGAVFGEEDTKTIYEFYGNRYNEIITEIIPFVTNVVVPKVRELAQEQRKSTMQKYNRKQRRFFEKKVR